MKTILHPTDFSMNAAVAFRRAYSLAKKLNARLVLLHVSEQPGIMDSNSELPTYEAMEEEKTGRLTRQLEDYARISLHGINDDVPLNYQVRLSGSLINGMLDVVREINPFMVVLGTRGGSKVKEMVMGSTARKMVRQSPCPVLAVPENDPGADLNNVIYASDFDLHDLQVLPQISLFTGMFNENLTVLHVFETESGTKEEESFRKNLAALGFSGEVKYVSLIADNTAFGISSYLNESGADLLVMYEKEHGNMIDRLFHEDMVKYFSTHSKVSLLNFNRHSLVSEK